MAARLYPKGRENFLLGNIAWVSNNIKVLLIDTAKYTYSTSHEFLTSIGSSAIVKKSTGNLASKTATGGVANAAASVLASVSGASAEAIVVYQDTGSSGTSRLIMYDDAATGLPITPTGANITVSWSTGANKIFKL